MNENMQKQIYLKENILDVGYDPTEFAAYMNSLKEGGTNIVNWTFEELEEIVQNFIKIEKQKEAVKEYESFNDPSSNKNQEYDSGDDEYGYDKPDTQPSVHKTKDNDYDDEDLYGYSRDKDIERKETGVEEQAKQSKDTDLAKDKVESTKADDKKKTSDADSKAPIIKLGTQGEEEKKHDSCTIQIAGLKVAPNLLTSQKEIKVSVSDPQVHDDGFFTSKYVTYLVKVNCLNLEVRRKDKHFKYIQEYLAKMCPYVLVPCIPEVQSDKKLDIKYLTKRASYLEEFLNKSLESDDLRLVPMFNDFLTMTDRKKYSAHIKTNLKVAEPPSGIKEFYTLTGTHGIDDSKHIINFSDKLSMYMNVYETCCDKFNDLTRKLASQMLESSKTLSELADCSKYMAKMYKLSDNYDFSKLYVDVQSMLDKWSVAQTNLTKIVSSNLTTFYSLPTLHLNSLRRLDQVKQTYQSNYEKLTVNLQKKKEKAFSIRNTQTWQLSIDDLKRVKELLDDKEEAYKAMFPGETKEALYAKHNYYFIANKCYNEIRRENRVHMVNTHENFLRLSHKMKDLLLEYKIIWDEFETKYENKTFPIENDEHKSSASSESTPKAKDPQ